MDLRRYTSLIALLLLPACAGEDEGPDESSVVGLVPAELAWADGCAPRTESEAGLREWAPTLSATGCYAQGTDGTWAPVDGAIHYGVRSPLWSDGADKRRHLMLPRDGVIEVREGGLLGFPDGTVVAKDFVLDGVLIETRLLVREGPRWEGVSYRYRDDGSDADALPAGLEAEIGDQIWPFPSEDDCASCHTRAAGVVLGLSMEQIQMEWDMFGLGAVDQVAAFEHLDLFDRPIEAADRVPPLAPLDDENASLEYRARSYLAANCGGCHRPGGAAHADIDLRMATPLGGTGLCDESDASYGFPSGARRVEAGAPESSVLLHLIGTVGLGQMPPLGRNLANDAAVELMSEWIASMEACE